MRNMTAAEGEGGRERKKSEGERAKAEGEKREEKRSQQGFSKGVSSPRMRPDPNHECLSAHQCVI